MTEALMSVEDLSQYLNIKVSRIYDCWRAWQLPALRVGGTLRFRRQDVDAWLSKRGAA